MLWAGLRCTEEDFNATRCPEWLSVTDCVAVMDGLPFPRDSAEVSGLAGGPAGTSSAGCGESFVVGHRCRGLRRISCERQLSAQAAAPREMSVAGGIMKGRSGSLTTTSAGWDLVDLRQLMHELDSREIDAFFQPTHGRCIADDFGDTTSGIQGVVLASRMVGVSWDAIRARTGKDIYAAVSKTELPKSALFEKSRLRDQLVVSTLLFKSMLTIRMTAAAILELESLLRQYGATDAEIKKTGEYLRTQEMRRSELVGARSERNDQLRYAAMLRRADEVGRDARRVQRTLPSIRRKCVDALAMLDADSALIAEAVGVSRRSGDRARGRWDDLRPASLGAWGEHELATGWDTYRRELLEVAYRRIRNDVAWAEDLVSSGRSAYRALPRTPDNAL